MPSVAFSFPFNLNLILTLGLTLLYITRGNIRERIGKITRITILQNKFQLIFFIFIFYTLYMMLSLGLMCFEYYGTYLVFFPINPSQIDRIILLQIPFGAKALLLWDMPLLDVHGDMFPITGYDGSWYWSFTISDLFIIFPSALLVALFASIGIEYKRDKIQLNRYKRALFGTGIVGSILIMAGFVLNSLTSTRAACSICDFTASIGQRLFNGSMIIEENFFTASIKYWHVAGLIMILISVISLGRDLKGTSRGGNLAMNWKLPFITGIMILLFGFIPILLGMSAHDLYNTIYPTLIKFGKGGSDTPMLADLAHRWLQTIISFLGYGALSIAWGTFFIIRGIKHMK